MNWIALLTSRTIYAALAGAVSYFLQQSGIHVNPHWQPYLDAILNGGTIAGFAGAVIFRVLAKDMIIGTPDSPKLSQK